MSDGNINIIYEYFVIVLVPVVIVKDSHGTTKKKDVMIIVFGSGQRHLHDRRTEWRIPHTMVLICTSTKRNWLIQCSSKKLFWTIVWIQHNGLSTWKFGIRLVCWLIMFFDKYVFHHPVLWELERIIREQTLRFS